MNIWGNSAEAGAPSGINRENIARQNQRPGPFKFSSLNDFVRLLGKVPYNSRAIETI